jgi:hypothetical protein
MEEIMELKANPFLFVADDYHEFQPLKDVLSSLFPNTEVTFNEISNDEIEDVDDDMKVGSGHYAAWFEIKLITPTMMDLDTVIEAFEWVHKELLEDAESDHAKEYNIVKMYEDDAIDYQSIIYSLKQGATSDALQSLGRLDTASRERIWRAPQVVDNQDGFMLFMEANRYPNILPNGSMY